MTTITARSSRRRPTASHRLLLACAIALAVSGLAHADAVTDWNANAGTVAPRAGGPQQQARAMAMTQIAVHDALNSIDRRYMTYIPVSPASAGASPDAAVAAAAYRVLLNFVAGGETLQFPSGPNTLDGIYAAALAAIPDGTAKTQGIAAGTNAANAIVALRTGDGSATPHLPYVLAPGPGVYQPTPNPEFPTAITPLFAGWANVTPFALTSATQFEVPPGKIFNLSSSAYKREYNEVKEVGNALVRAAAPDSEETDVARFWPGGGANWNLNARIIVEGLGLDLWEHARLFALMNMAEADAHIANQKYKYTFNFWRPVTAIRWADDGNARTESDPAWRPLLVTPPYPDYPSALNSGTGADAAVLRRFLGTDNVSFTRTVSAPALPLPAPLAPLPAKTITLEFDSLTEATASAVDARVFAGLHYRSADEAGRRHGTQIGRFVYRNYLRPVKGLGSDSNEMDED